VIGGPAGPMQPFPSSAAVDAQRERMRSPTLQNHTSRQPPEPDGDQGAPQGSEDDEVILGSGRSREGAFSPDGSRSGRSTARSPTPTNANPTRAKSPTMNGPSTQPPQPLSSRLAARSPSPVVSTPPPGDAFHYSSRTGAGAASTKQPTNGSNVPRAGSPASNVAADSLRGSSSNELLRDLRAKDAELESARRRETWMRAALLKARSQGFVWGDQDLSEALRDPTPSDDTPVDRHQLRDMILMLKTEHARLEVRMSFGQLFTELLISGQTTVASQARSLSERFAEADRIKTGALQETAFYRAKLAAYEAGAAGDVARLERDHAAGLERQLASAMADRQSQERRLADLTESLTTLSQLREQAEDQASAAIKRAEAAEANHINLSQLHDDLQDSHTTTQNSLREHASKVTSLTSLLQQREAEDTNAQARLESLSSTRDEHVRALQQLEQALNLATTRAEEAEAHWSQSRDRVAQLEAEQVELRHEIEARAHEAEVSVARVADLENAWARSREEADQLRALTTGSLGKLLDSHSEIRANTERGLNGQSEKITALEEEVSNLQLLLKESEKQSSTHQSELQAQRRRVRDLTTEQVSLHAQMSGLRAQLAEHISASGQLRQDLTDCEARLHDATRAASDSELRLGTLRNYLAESGIIVDIEELIANGPAASSTAASARVRELEAELAAESGRIEDLERRLANAVKDGRSGSSLGDADAITRAENAERALAEAIEQHKQQMQRIEEDYQTAVHYVKWVTIYIFCLRRFLLCHSRTEKMMRRVKDEHTRQKQLSSSLQSELDALRNGSETSSRTRVVNGRITPLSDDSHENSMRTQLTEASRQLQRATAENTELHKKVAALQTEVEQLRESLAAARNESDLRVQQIEDLETEMDRLDAALQAARHQSQASFAEQLYQENAELKRENDLLQQRIGLLLDVDQPGRNPNRLSGRPDSHSSSIKDHAFDALSSELDDWLATSSSSRRPLSEYEPEVPPARGPVRVIGS
jgi:DNA repair exonuclease SbcCD ATPase subunit